MKFSKNFEHNKNESSSKPHKSFLNFSGLLTNKYQKQLENLEIQYQNFNPKVSERISLLALDSFGVSGQAKASYGIVGIDEKFFNFPKKIQETLLIHEKVHVAVGSELRNESLLANHAKIDNFFHKKILPEWKEGNIELEVEKDYFLTKRWASLYPGWNGPLGVTKEKGKTTIDNYFSLVEKDLISYRSNIGLIHPLPTTDSWEEIMKKENQDLMSLYKNNPQQIALFIMTGYELMTYLQDAYRSALSSKENLDIYHLEEGFANYVSTASTGVSLQEFNSYAPQDVSKVVLAEKIISQKPELEKALKVHSYHELISFFKELDLIK